MAATGVKAPTLLPVYTAKTVSKLDPAVERVAAPLAGAVQLYQIENPGAWPAWEGSPVSAVALTELPVRVQEVPVKPEAEAKLSLAGRTTGGALVLARALAKLSRPALALPVREGIGSVPLSRREIRPVYVSVGYWAAKRASAPETCGVAMEVPL